MKFTFFSQANNRKVQQQFVMAIEDRSANDLRALVAKHGPNIELDLVGPYDSELGGPFEVGTQKVSALHFAIVIEADSPHAGMVEELLASGTCDVNVRDERGRTPLHYAAIFQSISAAQMLITNNETDLNLSDIDGFAAIHLATGCTRRRSSTPLAPPIRRAKKTARNPPTTVFDLLISYSAKRCNINKITIKSCETILHLLCSRPTPSRFPIIAAILTDKNFTHWNAKDSKGCTALRRLVEADLSESVTDMLLTEGADRWDHSVVDNIGETILHTSIRYQRSRIFATLLLSPQVDLFINIKNNRGMTPLWMAILLRGPQWATNLIQCPLCDLNIRYGGGLTAIHLAAMERRLSLLEDLINSGRCNLQACDRHRNTALFKIFNDVRGLPDAEWSMCLKTLLSDEGTDINHKNWEGHTPLVSALTSRIQTGAVVATLILINNGADVNAVDSDGQTILQHYIDHHHHLDTEASVELLTMLLDAGLDVSQYPDLSLQWVEAAGVKRLLAAEGVPSAPPPPPPLPLLSQLLRTKRASSNSCCCVM